MTGVRTFVFVAYDDFQLLDLAGPADVLRVATLLGADPPYDTVVATLDGRPARSTSGVEVSADASLAELVHDWFPDADLRGQVCVANPARLYGYPHGELS